MDILFQSALAPAALGALRRLRARVATFHLSLKTHPFSPDARPMGPLSKTRFYSGDGGGGVRGRAAAGGGGCSWRDPAWAAWAAVMAVTR